ncbi:hypothetical protein A2Z33_01785 [Candidatus Gottesmanbacteria bacterium RBG_16_52_11]|uniref:DUF4349 domain-containing protein n=1 Tax=Candidatus Gottesmanbacteria bacterium RBG_16_52_11 TaxID=1798374 RepID=A0A1F5YQR2_9BACT|nr:MAG: hypothetical protein A2Z33_01785 [Candidatus Gottesmanbacteria bacterium RBG_16_52_11]
MPIITWIRKNKLSAFLLAVIGFYILKSFTSTFLGSVSLGQRNYSKGIGGADFGMALPAPMNLGSDADMIVPSYGEAAPQPEITDRMVVQESYLSLLVKNVVESRNRILTLARENGGYMVSASTENPQDAATANITIRVKSESLEPVLTALRGLAVKVVSENLRGTDVTDEYVDIEKRIAIYEKTKAQYEAILERAQEISDITNLTSQIISTQGQIDRLRGQQEGMKQRSATAKITVYLSTDELALPYAPTEMWRPEVIFKQAVRSLVGHARKLGTIAIWTGVYAVIWLPALVIILLIRKRMQKPPLKKTN